MLLIIMLCISSSLFAEEMPISWKAEKSETYVQDNKIVKVILKGNVQIKKGLLTVKADEIVYNRETDDILARGKVVFLQKGKRIEGKELLYNLSGESGSLKEVRFFSPPWYGKAKEAEIEKKGEYLLKDGYITTCDLDPPHYRLKAKKIKISVDNKIEAKKITFCIRRSPIDKPLREIPILYLPYYSQNLDIKKEAQSFLTFVPGYSSEWGVYLLTTVNTFLNPYFSASYYLDLREKKGVGIGFDLEKKPEGKNEEGVLKTYYLRESDTNENRYRVGYKYKNVWEKKDRDLTLLSEMHKLSDAQFLKDYFYDDYLEEKQPRSYLFFSERKAERFLGLLARVRINDFYPVTERLPEMNLSFPFQRLVRNLYFRSETTIVNLRKEIEGETKSLLRLDAFNEITSSKRYGGWLNVRPHVGSRFTFYAEDKEGKDAFRSLGEAGLDLGTKFQKPFTMRKSSFTHIVEPGL
ncbi:MAG: LPS assembly protein LptD, partial [Acidobacteriota bacterium]|nr:LPS assembly protein LptD [Acidobacteriota bacterium]